MDTSIQIQHRRERDDALATALGHVVLKFLTVRINGMLAIAALLFLCAWMATGRHMQVAIFAIVAWVSHLAVMLIIDIAKGGDQL